MKTKDITPLQYATWYGCSLQYVTRLIRDNKSLPEVLRIKKFSRFYLLEVRDSLDAESFKELKTNILANKPKIKK